MEKMEQMKVHLGGISIESPNGVNYSGTKAMEFESIEAMNAWFEGNFGHLVVQLFPHTRVEKDGALRTGIVAIVAKVFDEEELQELADINAIVGELKAKRKAEREAQELENQLAQQKHEDDLKELQALGRKCRENHGGVIEDNIRLKKEVKTLKSKAGKE